MPPQDGTPIEDNNLVSKSNNELVIQWFSKGKLILDRDIRDTKVTYSYMITIKICYMLHFLMKNEIDRKICGENIIAISGGVVEERYVNFQPNTSIAMDIKAQYSTYVEDRATDFCL